VDIITLASSSKGNCYIIKSNGQALMIECGLPLHEIHRRLFKNQIDFAEIMAVAVTHSHGDHATAALDLSKSLPILASAETLKACGIKANGYAMDEWQPVNIGAFTITSFSVDHDCDGAVGFIIETATERLLFINDTKLVKWDFSGFDFDHVMIECNHCADVLNLKDERTRRVAQSHMSLETTKLTLQRMNLHGTQAIYLMHLSSGNSDEHRMIAEVQKVTGIPTRACRKDGGVTNGYL
jgi:phosphoribosyl 1,2-cyclic phosphodiesterase